MHLPAKFDVNRIISNETAAKNVKTRWRRRPSWIFGPYFRFCVFPLVHDVPYLCFKFHQNPSIFALVMAIYVNPRWPPPPSCFWVLLPVFWFYHMQHHNMHLPAKFDENPIKNKKRQLKTWKQDGGGGHLEFLASTSGFAFLRFGMMPSTCVSNFIKFRQYLPELWPFM